MAKIHFVEKGSGSPIVLLHGFCETNDVWDEFSSPLSQNYRIITPDLPGFGNSAPIHGPFELNDIALTLLDWLDSLMLGSCLLIGHSLGGYITLAMARHQPERFAGFGLFHSTANADTPEKKDNRYKVNDFVQRNGAEAFIKNYVPGLFFDPGHEAVSMVRKIADRSKAQSIIDYNLAMTKRPSHLEFLSTFQNPILMIGGHNDSIIPIATLQEQSKLNSQIHFHAIQETGHMGMYESPSRTRQIIQNFAELCDFRTT